MERTIRVKKRYLEHAFVGVFSSLIVAPMFVIGAGYIDDTSAQLFNTARIVAERAIESINNDLAPSFPNQQTNQQIRSVEGRVLDGTLKPTYQTSQLAVVIESEPSNTDSVRQQSFWDRIISSISRFFSSLMWWNGELGMENGAVDGIENGELGMENVEQFIPPAETETQPASYTQTQDQTSDISNPTPAPVQIRERIIERIIERTTPAPTLVAGVSESAMDEKFVQLSNALKAEIYRVESNASRQGNGNFSAIALTQRIDNLANVTISNATMSGSTISNTTISGSTFYGALGNITDLTASNFTTTNATTTNLAVSGNSYFSALTAGSVPFIGANGLLSQNNSQIFWDSVNSRLGIGTSTPYAKLSVAGEVVGSHFTATTTTDNTFPNLIATNATTTNATSTNFYSTNIFGVNSNITNSTTTNATSTNFFSATATVTDFIAGNSTSTNATSTSSFATTASSTSLFSQFASIVGLNVINSTTTSATSTNFYSTNIFGANSNITNATTTSSFATTASSTSLFTSNFSLGSISGFLKATAGAVTNALVNLATDITGILGIANGGTNNSSFSTDSLTYFDGTRLTSTSSPTVGYITATSTTATSTFAGGLTAGTNGLTVLQSGNVGIGTTTPGAKLDVRTTTAGFGQIIVNSNGASDANGLLIQAGTVSTEYSLKVTDTGGTNPGLVVKGNGNVGIGTTSPATTLDVNGGIRATLAALGANTGQLVLYKADGTLTTDTTQLTWDSSGDTMSVNGLTIGANVIRANGSGNLTLTNDNLSPVAVTILGSTGNVGIGTTNPGVKLSVFSGGAGTVGQLDLGYDNTAYYRIGRKDTAGADSGNFKIMPNAGTSVFDITSTGNVGIGTTGPGTKLDVVGAIQGTDLIRSTGGSANGAGAGAEVLMSSGKASFWGYNRTTLASVATEVGRSDAVTTINGSTVNLIGGNVGIGTTGPGSVLTLNKAAGAVDTLVQFNVGDVVKAYAGTANQAENLIAGSVAGDFGIRTATQKIMFSTNSGATAHMVIATSGNVGIGTTNPAFKFEVSTSTVGTVARFVNSNGNGAIKFNLNDGSDSLGLGANWRHSIQVGSSESLAFQTGATNVPRMVIDTNGNVGIGTTTPAYKLDVNGDFRVGVAGATANSLYVNTTLGNVGIGTTNPGNKLTLQDGAFGIGDTAGGSNASFSYSAGKLQIGLDSAGTDGIYFREYIPSTGYADHMVIKNTGNVGIGTTSPQAKLHVSASSGEAVIRVGDTNAVPVLQFQTAPSFTNWAIAAQKNVSNALEFTPSTAVGGTTFTTPAMTILSTGNVGIGTTAPGAKLEIGKPAANTYSTRAKWNQDAHLLLTDYYTPGATAVTKLVMNTSSGGYNSGAIIHVEGAGSYDAGQLVFSTGWDSSGNATERMRINSIGNIGIGTTTPLATLNIVGNGVDSGGGELRMRNLAASHSDYGLTIGARGVTNNGFGIYDYTSSATRLYIDTSGNVGIGTTGPLAKLDVRSAITAESDGQQAAIIADTSALATGIGPDLMFYSTYTSGGSVAAVGRIGTRRENATTGNLANALVFGTRGASGNVTERVRIDSSGNVGIGTTNPGAKLVSNVSAVGIVTGLILNNQYIYGVGQGTAATRLAFGRDNSGTGQTIIGGAIDSGNEFETTSNSQYMAFSTKNGAGTLGEKVRITSEGNVGIGTTTPTQTFSVSQAAVGIVARFQNGTGYCDINPTTTALVCTSDATLKKNVVTLGNSLDSVLALRGVNFNWLVEQEGTPAHVGFIAQEVEKILPELVATDIEGKKSVNYIGFIPVIVEAVKELALKVESLVLRIASLEMFTQNQVTNGIITKDRVTGEEYCMFVSGGTMQTTKGACSGAQTVPASNNNQATTTEPIVIQIQGNNPATINVGDVYGDLGAIITSPLSAQNFGIKASLDGGELGEIGQINVDTSVAGVHSIIYSVFDQTSTTTAERILNVVSVEPATPAVDISALTSAITGAQSTHDSAVEGTAVGEYAVDSKAILQTAITTAGSVKDNTSSLQADIDTAVTTLNTAVTTFEEGKVL